MDSSHKRQGPIAGVLASSTFRRLWLIGGVVNAMRWLEMLAAGLFTFDATGSGLAVAFVLAARSLPMLLFGAVAGVVCDAVSRKRVLFAGMAISAAVAAMVAILAARGGAQPWHLAVAAFVSGTVWATELSARRRMIGECAGVDHVSRVIALDSLTNSAARIVGPLMGSVAFAWLGLSGAFAISAACYVVCAAVVPGIAHSQPPQVLALARIPRDLADGFRYAARQPAVLTVLAVTATMNLFAFSYAAMVAPIARVGFGVGDAAVGLLAAGEPLGALAGGLLLARRPPPANPGAWLIGGSVLFVVSLMLMPVMPGYAGACLVLIVGGLGMAVFGNTQTSIILTGTPVALRSRVMGLITVAIGVAPLGQMLIGVLSDQVGPLQGVVVSAAMGCAALLAIDLARRRAGG